MAFIEESTTQNIICILDRSGSMMGLTSDVIGGFNSFVEEQRKVAGDAKLTLVIFDGSIETVYEDVDINEVPELTSDVYFARGSTSLYDAIGTAVNGKNLDNALVMIQTDGYENTSREYTKDSIKTLIDEKEAQGWEFVFLGADIDAAAESSSIGIVASKSLQMDKTSMGIHDGFATMNAVATSYRAGDYDGTVANYTVKS